MDTTSDNQTPKILHVRVRSTAEHEDSPRFASIELTAQLLKRIELLCALCAQHRLSYASEWNSCAEWGPDSIAEELRIGVEQLVATQHAVFFSGMPKYGFGEVQTDSMLPQQLRAISEDASGPKHWIWAENTAIAVTCTAYDPTGPELLEELLESGRLAESVAEEVAEEVADQDGVSDCSETVDDDARAWGPWGKPAGY